MKKIQKYIAIILIIGVVYIVYAFYPRLDIITGFSAKSMASGMFLAERTQVSVSQGDNDFSPIKFTKNSIDLREKSVTATIYGLKSTKAIYREGLGAVVINEDYKVGQKLLVPQRNRTPKQLPYPYGVLPRRDTVFATINYENLHKAVESAFDKNDNDDEIKKTRSVLVIYKDQILAEKYAPGFDEKTPILGWSMTKSFTSTIYGI